MLWLTPAGHNPLRRETNDQVVFQKFSVWDTLPLTLTGGNPSRRETTRLFSKTFPAWEMLPLTPQGSHICRNRTIDKIIDPGSAGGGGMEDRFTRKGSRNWGDFVNWRGEIGEIAIMYFSE